MRLYQIKSSFVGRKKENQPLNLHKCTNQQYTKHQVFRLIHLRNIGFRCIALFRI